MTSAMAMAGQLPSGHSGNSLRSNRLEYFSSGALVGMDGHCDDIPHHYSTLPFAESCNGGLFMLMDSNIIGFWSC